MCACSTPTVPTETTVAVTTQELQQEDLSQPQLPIGPLLPGNGGAHPGRGATRQGGGAATGPADQRLCGGEREFCVQLRVGAEQMPVYRTGDRVRWWMAGWSIWVGATTSSR